MKGMRELSNIEKEAIRDVVTMAEIYAKIYEPRFRNVAKNAFIDGMTFLHLMRDTKVDTRKMNEDLFRLIRDTSERIVKEGCYEIQ